MSMKTLNTICVEENLGSSSDLDVCTSGKSISDQQEAVNAVWTHRPDVSVDEVLLKDAAKLLKSIKRSKKLKRLTFKRRRQDNSFAELPAAIASNGSELEDLNIPGLKLSSNDVRLLSSCTSLKRLNIKYAADATEFVEQLVAKNHQLEEIRLECITLEGCITNNIFENLPETIKRIEIINDDGKLENYNSFWNRVPTWRLEKLEFNILLTEDHIRMLSRQTTLKYLGICFDDIGNSLEILFRNNPRLEEVSLNSYNSINGCCLKYLPPTLKCLKCLWTYWDLDDDIFVECVKTWSLQSLILYFKNNINLIMRVLNAAPSLSEVNINVLDILPDQKFLNVKNLAQLNVLHLLFVPAEHYKLLKILLENSVNLQKLKLNIKVFDRKIFSVIAALPKLEQFCLDCETFNRVHYVSCLQELSRSRCLTTVYFESCSELSKTDILLLIRESRTLTKLGLGLRHFLKTSKNFLKEIVLEFKKQTDRRKVLTVEIKSISKSSELQNIRTSNLHPLLNLEFITCGARK